MGMAMIGKSLEKLLNSQFFSDLLLARADHCASKKLQEEKKKRNHCAEYNLLNLSNLNIKLKRIWDRGEYSDVI